MTATLIRSARVVTLLLAVAALLGLVVRLPSIAEPLGIDQGLLSSAAQQMARGQLLYRDIFDQKPPGIYLTYLAAFSVFGWNPASVAWLDLAASALIALLLYAVVRELADGVMGAAAAAVYSTLTIPSWLYRHGGFLERSVAETFITVLVGMAAWCAARLVRGGSRWWSLGLGLFGGAAVMYKPNAGGYFVALLIWTLLYDQRDRSRAIGVTLSAIAAAAIVPLATLAWFWIDGVLPEARVALIDFNRAYVATGFSAERYGVDFSKAVWLRMKTDPLWAAGGLASLAAAWDFARTRRLAPVPALAIAWGAAAALAIVVNGARLFNSYFIQALAPLAILAAWHLTTAVRGHAGRKLAGAATVAVMLFLLLVKSSYPSRVLEFAADRFRPVEGSGRPHGVPGGLRRLRQQPGLLGARQRGGRGLHRLPHRPRRRDLPVRDQWRRRVLRHRSAVGPSVHAREHVRGVRPRRPRLPAAGGYRGDRAPAAALSHL